MLEAARSVVITGMGCGEDACDPTPFLRQRKLRKFMGRQDDMAVAAAARALAAASLEGPRGERTGLYMAVGYIPFETSDIERLLDASLEAGRFSMPRFASQGFGAINPLLTFRVLPNMPAFHVSLNFDVQGPYHVGYPGAGQFYMALEEAFAALRLATIDVALVGAVADQTNGLVEHHFSRLTPPVAAGRLANGAAFLVLERDVDAAARGVRPAARLVEYSLEYVPADPLIGRDAYECFARGDVCLDLPRSLGPASLPATLAATSGGRLTHRLRSRDGFNAASTWEIA